MTTATTCDELLADYAGGTGTEWVQLRVEADRLGRLDLVQFCIDQAEAAYECDDQELDA